MNALVARRSSATALAWILFIFLIQLACFGKSSALWAATSSDPASLQLPQVPTTIKIQTGKFGTPSVGDIIELTVTPDGDLSNNAEPAMAEQLKAAPVEHGDSRILWWKRGNGNAIIIGLTSYKTGKFQISPISFVRNGKAVFTSQPQEVEFAAIGGDKSKDDIYAPEAVGFPRWVWVLIGLAALGLVVGALWWLARWNQKRKAERVAAARVPKVLTPIEEFEKLRSEVETKQYVDKGVFKPHYFALSEAAKRFLGKAYRFDAEERTTRELLRELESLSMSPESIGEWGAIFDEMDIVKFTDRSPQREVARSLSERLSRLVAASYRSSPVARENALATVAKGAK
jgi:hypothetical protein